MPAVQRKHPKSAAIVRRVAGIYSRVSRLDPRLTEDEAESIEHQDDECREAAEENSWPIFKEYADPGISASEYARHKVRPDWNQLLADIEAGHINVVILWESSRGDRKDVEWSQFLQLCKDHRTLIHIVSHDIDAFGVTYDVTKNGDMYKLKQEGLDNWRESTKIADRLRRGKRRRRIAGKPDNNYAYGYRRVYNERTGKCLRQEPDEPTAAGKVRQVFARLAALEPAQVVADAVGLPVVRVRRMYLITAYISVIEHDGESYEAKWRPVLYVPGEHRDNCEEIPLEEGTVCPGCEPDRALFYKVVSIFAARQLVDERPGKLKYMLSGVPECSVEGCAGTGRVQPGGERTVMRKGKPRTLWMADKYAGMCGHWGINKEELETHVSAVVVAYYSKPGRYDQLIKTDDTEVMAAQADINRIESELKDLERQARQGGSAALLLALDERLRSELAEAEERRKSSVPPAVRQLLEGPVQELAQRWVAMPVAAQREIVRATVRVVVHPAGRRGLKVPVADRVEILPVRKE